MARGRAAQPGDTRVAANGYHYTRTETEWRLTHHIIAEEKILGRPLLPEERVVFIGSRRELHPDNIKVTVKGRGSTRRRIAQIEARIEELKAERALLLKEVQEDA
jgi:hypothetical protein